MSGPCAGRWPNIIETTSDFSRYIHQTCAALTTISGGSSEWPWDSIFLPHRQWPSVQYGINRYGTGRYTSIGTPRRLDTCDLKPRCWDARLVLPPKVLSEAWVRSMAACGCRLADHQHVVPCGVSLRLANRGSEGEGAWEAHHIVPESEGGSDKLDNCHY